MQPDKYDYMSESDKAAYDEAYSVYEEELALYQNGIIETARYAQSHRLHERR